MNHIFEEFKKFALRGNVFDLAVGVVIGTAFGKIVSSFVSDIIMPPIGYLTSGVDLSNLVFVLKKESAGVAAITIKYGVFLNTVINFLIISFVIFIAVKQVNHFHKKEAKKPVKLSKEVELLTEIRDVLVKK